RLFQVHGEKVQGSRSPGARNTRLATRGSAYPRATLAIPSATPQDLAIFFQFFPGLAALPFLKQILAPYIRIVAD
ncbi:hypothetical protein, partial [uncultured Varibaculum sp.]|uniref:hypothetical protein n=1 Tax=uncultured Varibaculum sp. TaxID=413896 RepID=UPI002806107E